MSKLKEDLEAHKAEAEEHYKHFSQRLDHFANYLQSAMNPTVKLKNGEEQEVFMSEAVVMIYDDVKYVKGKLYDLDERTRILEDFNQIKNNWLALKTRLTKILKPVVKLIVVVSTVFIIFYLIILIAVGKLSFKNAIEYFIKLFF